MTTYVDRVRRGAALLDQRGPADWRDRVDVDRLNLRWMDTCVLGQVYTGHVESYYGYDVGLDALDAPGDADGAVARDDWAQRHGFEEPTDGNYDALTRAWVDYLTTETETQKKEIE